MDKSLDDVRCILVVVTRRPHLSFFLFFVQIVAATRVAKQTRRPRRGNNARSQVLGATGTSPVAKARITSTAKTASVPPQPIEKIVVSNLPPDVNEAQVKVK